LPITGKSVLQTIFTTSSEISYIELVTNLFRSDVGKNAKQQIFLIYSIAEQLMKNESHRYTTVISSTVSFQLAVISVLL